MDTTLEHKPKQCDLVLHALRERQWVPFEAVVQGYDAAGKPYRITQQNARKNELQRAGFPIITRMRKRDPELDNAEYMASDWRLADADDAAVSYIAQRLAIIGKDTGDQQQLHVVAMHLPLPVRGEVADTLRVEVCHLTPETARNLVAMEGGHRNAAAVVWRSYIDAYCGRGVTTVRGCADGKTTSAEQCDACGFSRCVNRLGVL